MRFLVLLLLLVGVAHAETSGVLIAEVPHADDKPVVISAVKQAFVGRRWTIDRFDESSVTASLDRAGTRALLRVFMQGDDLRYEDTSTRVGAASHAPAGAYAPMERPIKLGTWLNNIRADVAALLAGIPDRTPSARDTAARDIADRLKALETLRTTGLITDDEYKTKRAEILRDL